MPGVDSRELLTVGETQIDPVGTADSRDVLHVREQSGRRPVCTHVGPFNSYADSSKKSAGARCQSAPNSHIRVVRDFFLTTKAMWTAGSLT
jgi:hypothetical protein